MNHNFSFTAAEDGSGLARYSVGSESVHIKMPDFKTAHKLSQMMDLIYVQGTRDELIKSTKAILEQTH